MQAATSFLIYYIAPTLLGILLYWRLFTVFKPYDENNTYVFVFRAFLSGIWLFGMGVLGAILMVRPEWLGVEKNFIQNSDFAIKAILTTYTLICFLFSFLLLYTVLGALIYKIVFKPLYRAGTKIFREEVYEKMTWSDFFANHSPWFHFKFHLFDKYETRPNIWKYIPALIIQLILVAVFLKFILPNIYEIILDSRVLYLKLKGVEGGTRVALYVLRILLFIIYITIIANLALILKCFFNTIIKPSASFYYYQAKSNYEKGNKKMAKLQLKRLQLCFDEKDCILIHEGKIKYSEYSGTYESLQSLQWKNKSEIVSEFSQIT